MTRHRHHGAGRWRHSLRARLVLLFVIFALALAAVFLLGTSRMVKTGWQAWARPAVSDYLDRLAAEIGSPPDPAKARALEARLPIVVRIDGPEVHYDSAHGGRSRFDDAERSGAFSLARSTADGHRIRFALAVAPDHRHPTPLGWITLAALLVLTLAAWVVVQRLLGPLRSIGDGAARFGRGDFAQPIVVRRRDELGELAERVNAMARALERRLEDQRALLLAISHELRSPLTRARLNAELVAEGPARDALLRDLAEMRDLISKLLESERIAAGAPALQLAPVDLVALVRRAAEGRVLGLEIPESLDTVQADATRIELLLRNLLDNATRHAGEAAEPPLLFVRREPDGRLALGVRDHGPGVPPDQLERLAQPFHRPDSARSRAAGGVGLGLYLCRLVAQAHGGELRLRNAGPGFEAAMVWRAAAAEPPAVGPLSR